MLRHGKLILALFLMFLIANIPAFACATCGCSGVCQLAVTDESGSVPEQSLLSNSIWGNMILKMAYQRDPEVQRLSRKLKLTGSGTGAALATVAGGTIAQGAVSMGTLNPPEPLFDSYAPGIIGLSLSSSVLMIFTGSPLLTHHYRKQMKARQLAIRQQVEEILGHLEFSQTKCAEAQKDLTALVGERGARECIELWQSSHQVTGEVLPKISQVDSGDR